MPLSRERDYLSIGEVLETIRTDFPDVSISKIRFLENEGLIAPERTASGYRKFYEPDVARLRYILGLQRDHFLPLKVIKQRLAELQGDGVAAEELPAEGRDVAATAGAESDADADVSLTRGELAARTGLSEQQLAELEEYSILHRRAESSYGSDDLEIARAAAGLFAFGVEARHMRMFRQATDREVALIDQIVAPLRHRRDPQAQREVDDSVRELAQLNRRMRDALLRSSLEQLA